MALLVPARRDLESFGYRVMTAGAAMQLGRARSSSATSSRRWPWSARPSATLRRDRITHRIVWRRAPGSAEVLVFGGRLAEAAAALAQARELERGVGETPLSRSHRARRADARRLVGRPVRRRPSASRASATAPSASGRTYEMLVVLVPRSDRGGRARAPRRRSLRLTHAPRRGRACPCSPRAPRPSALEVQSIRPAPGLGDLCLRSSPRRSPGRSCSVLSRCTAGAPGFVGATQ